MSAPVVLTVPDQSFVVAAVSLLDQFADGLGAHATVGGIAVIIRVAAVHRATGDIDSAVRDLDLAAEAIVAAVGGRRRGNSVELDGFAGSVDLVDATVPVDEALAFEPADELEARVRARAVLMRVATETAERVAVMLRSPTGAVLLETELRVARPGILAAAKALSALDPSRNEDKRGTDVADLVLLTESYAIADHVADLAEVPAVIRAFHADDINTLTSDHLDRSMRWLSRSSRVDADAFSRERVAAAGTLARALR